MEQFTYTIIIRACDPDEGGYWVEVPTLEGCVTQGETIEEAIAMAKDAITCYIMGLKKAGEPIPPSDTNAQILVTPLQVEMPAA